MYPLTCRAGFAVPIKDGKFEIVGLSAVANDTDELMRITLVDEGSFTVINDTNYIPAEKPYLADMQGTIMLGTIFEEPIKVRNGANVVNVTNCVPGKTFLYIR